MNAGVTYTDGILICLIELEDDGMPKSKRANAVLFGFDFQVNAAIVLMLENIKELDFLRLEGKEDIELALTDGTEILAQAKAVENSSQDFKHVRENLKKALRSLSEGAGKCNAKELILITNSPNPLNDKNTMSIFYGEAHRKFETLPESAKRLIRGYLSDINEPLDPEKFKIQILPFETDDEKERYKVVAYEVDQFINTLRLSIPGISSELMEVWQDSIFHNGSKKKEEIVLKKKDIIWPILVIATDVERCDTSFREEFDSGLYNEIAHNYKSIIDSCCERYEFFIKILSDYRNFTCDKKEKDKSKFFALTQWENYVDEFQSYSMDEETQKGLIQIILYQIVTNRIMINNIKQEVQL